MSLTFDEKLPVDVFQRVDFEIREGLLERQVDQFLAEAFFDLDAYAVIGPAEKRILRQIAGQANPARNHNVGFRPLTFEPLSALMGERFQIHVSRSLMFGRK